jgi:hypothetical protein
MVAAYILGVQKDIKKKEKVWVPMHRLKLALLGVALVSAAPAATIFTEDFSGATIGFYNAGVITGTGFSIVSGSADIVGPGVGNYGHLCVAPAGGQCLDTHGSGATRGVIETTNLLDFNTPGVYTLSFALVRWNDSEPQGAGLQDSVVTVTIGGLFNKTYTVDGTWVNQTVTEVINIAAPSGTARIRFADGGGSAPYAGAILDNVTLDSPVPEPGTVALMSAGLLAAGLLSRRKK